MHSWNQDLNPESPTAEPACSAPKLSPYACSRRSGWKAWSSCPLPLPGNSDCFWKHSTRGHHRDRLPVSPGRSAVSIRVQGRGVLVPVPPGWPDEMLTQEGAVAQAWLQAACMRPGALLGIFTTLAPESWAACPECSKVRPLRGLEWDLSSLRKV